MGRPAWALQITRDLRTWLAKTLEFHTYLKIAREAALISSALIYDQFPARRSLASQPLNSADLWEFVHFVSCHSLLQSSSTSFASSACCL